MLNNVYMFSELAPNDANLLTEHSHTRSYPANTILINEGDQTDSLYVILDGEVKVYASDESGKEVILNILRAGEYFGELALVDDAPRSASVMTLTPVKVMMISKADFKSALVCAVRDRYSDSQSVQMNHGFPGTCCRSWLTWW